MELPSHEVVYTHGVIAVATERGTQWLLLPTGFLTRAAAGAGSGGDKRIRRGVLTGPTSDSAMCHERATWRPRDVAGERVAAAARRIRCDVYATRAMNCDLREGDGAAMKEQAYAPGAVFVMREFEARATWTGGRNLY